MEEEEIKQTKIIEDPAFSATVRLQGNPKKPKNSASVVTIPKLFCKNYNIEKGDYIKLKFEGFLSKVKGGKKNGKGRKKKD